MKDEKSKGFYENTVDSLVKYVFNTRFFIFRLTKRSKAVKKIADKYLFEGNELFVLPNKNTINNTKRSTITANIEINQSFEKSESEFVPSQIIKEVIKEANDIVIILES